MVDLVSCLGAGFMFYRDRVSSWKDKTVMSMYNARLGIERRLRSVFRSLELSVAGRRSDDVARGPMTTERQLMCR